MYVPLMLIHIGRTRVQSLFLVHEWTHSILYIKSQTLLYSFYKDIWKCIQIEYSSSINPSWWRWAVPLTAVVKAAGLRRQTELETGRIHKNVPFVFFSQKMKIWVKIFFLSISFLLLIQFQHCMEAGGYHSYYRVHIMEKMLLYKLE